MTTPEILSNNQNVHDAATGLIKGYINPLTGNPEPFTGGVTQFADLADQATVNLPAVNAPLAAALGDKAASSHAHLTSQILYLDAILADYSAQIAAKQGALVSGENVKTVNGQSVLGSGNLVVTASGGSIAGPYTLAQLKALSESGLTANSSMAYVSSPAPATGVYVWRGASKGWKLNSPSGVFAEIRAWFELSLRARARQVLYGKRREVWAPPAGFDLSKAVVPVTNDQTGLATAITAAGARSTNKVVVVRSSIALTGNLTTGVVGTADQPVVICSLNGAQLTGNFAIITQSYTDFIGLAVNGPHVFAATDTGQVRLRGVANVFTSSVTMGGTFPWATGGFGDGTTSNNTDHTGWVLALNEFIDCDYANYSQRLSDSHIRFNRVRYTTANTANRGIWITGGDNNRVSYNWITGGRVGIGALCDRSLTKSFSRNVIEHNLVEDIYEEGISIDGYGNVGAKCSVADRLVVASTTGTAASNPRLICNRVNTTGLAANNHAIQVISGSLAGRYFRITAVADQVAGTSVYLQVENNSLSTADLAALVGAQLLVVIHCSHNAYIGNVVLNAQTPLMLWGMGHATVISGNYAVANGTGATGASGLSSFGVSAAIGVWGIGIPSGPTAPSNGLAGSAYLCLPSDTVVQGNYVENGAIYVGGMTWETQANTEAVMDSIPHAIGGNNVSPTFAAWRNGNNVAQVYSEAVGTNTDPGGTYDAESLLLENAVPLPAME